MNVCKFEWFRFDKFLVINFIYCANNRMNNFHLVIYWAFFPHDKICLCPILHTVLFSNLITQNCRKKVINKKLITKFKPSM